MKADNVRPEDLEWVCRKCGRPLKTGTVIVEYLENQFTTELPMCRGCSFVLISEALALDKIAEVELIPGDGLSRLNLTVHCDPCRFQDTLADVRAALFRVPAVRDAVAQGLLDILPVRWSPENWFTTGAAKRTLIDRRQERSTL
jgi:hypothetical protein